VTVNELDDEPAPSIVRSALYRWNLTGKCYDCASHIQEGKGYWVAASAGCDLTMTTPV
jgi:hypothetical protein